MNLKAIKRRMSSLCERLSIALTVPFFFIASAHVARAELSLTALNPSPARIAGVDFPRENAILYRGVHDTQYNFVVAVAAMLGDERYNLESAMFRSVREILMGRNASLFSRIAGLKEEFALQNIMKLCEARRGDGNLSTEEAIRNAKEVMEKSYSLGFAKTRAIDYNSGTRDDNPKAFVYSTLHFEVARVYSPNIVIFHEKNPRSLDMNYWNKATNGKWVHTNRTYPDRGEFLTPFYISSNDIIGFQLGRKNFNVDWTVWRPITADLDIVFMKYVLDGVHYVMIFDGTQIQHILQEGDAFCSAQTRFDYTAEVPRLPEVDCSIKPALMGVLRTCPAEGQNENNCSFPSKLFKNYNLTENVNQDLLNKIIVHELPGQQTIQFSRRAIDPRSSTSDKPKNKTEKNTDTPPKTKKQT